MSGVFVFFFFLALMRSFSWIRSVVQDFVINLCEFMDIKRMCNVDYIIHWCRFWILYLNIHLKKTKALIR